MPAVFRVMMSHDPKGGELKNSLFFHYLSLITHHQIWLDPFYIIPVTVDGRCLPARDF